MIICIIFNNTLSRSFLFHLLLYFSAYPNHPTNFNCYVSPCLPISLSPHLSSLSPHFPTLSLRLLIFFAFFPFPNLGSSLILGQASKQGGAIEGIRIPPEGISMEKVEEALVRQALKMTSGNQTKAARLLDISRDALRYRMQKFGLLEF